MKNSDLPPGVSVLNEHINPSEDEPNAAAFIIELEAAWLEFSTLKESERLKEVGEATHPGVISLVRLAFQSGYTAGILKTLDDLKAR